MQADFLQSTTQRVTLKLFLTSDHVTPATGKTLAITISKNGAAFANPSAGATNATEIASGWYYVDLSTTDTGTLGPLIVLGTAASCDNADQSYTVAKATNRGMTALPDTAVTTNASLLTSGTGTDQLSVTTGRIDIGKALGTAITLDANNVINVSAKYWAGTAITATSIPVATAAGASGGLFIAGTNAATTITTSLTTHFVGTVDTVTTVTNQLTAAAIATGVWQDATAGDFATASSIGKALYIANVAPGGSGGHMISGSNAGTTTLAALTVTGAFSINGVSMVAQTGDSYARIGAPVGASISADIAAVKANCVTLIAGVTVTTNSDKTGYSVLLTQALSAARALDAIADTSLTLNDAFQCAVAGTVGQKDASSGTSMTVKTASTATLLRTYAITTASAPSTVPTKIV